MEPPNTYPQRVRDSILPRSVADNLPEAFDEWRFTGKTEDYHTPSETCELCEQEDLRYHFEIKNDFTDHILWVGSQCILRFELPVYDNGELLTAKDAKSLLNKLTQQMRLESCVKSLEALAREEESEILKSALAYYKRNKKLTPKLAFVVFWRLKKNKIDHHPSFFSINLKRGKYVSDLRDMPTERVHFFWQALTSAQRKKAISLGHSEP